MQPRMTTDELLARAELRALVERYATVTDAGDAQAWTDLFLPTGSFTSSNPGADTPFFRANGREELLGVLANNEQWERTFHMIGNHDCTVEDPWSAAKGTVYCMAHHLVADRDPRQSYIMLIKYHDEYVLTDSGWRFARRDQDFAWQELHAVDPHLMGMGESGRFEF